jgi:hypothetical protein
LRGANLSGANLYIANLGGADLYYANLRGADLSRADLSGANLYIANLRDANLRGANLRGANQRGADLRGADLGGANLGGANLYIANLGGANLPKLIEAQLSILPDGDIIGWKKCRGDIVVKLLIPSAAKRSNSTGRKCRADLVEVLEIFGADKAYSEYDNTEYVVGATIRCHKWDENRWKECSGGIHFFITREEAEKY